MGEILFSKSVGSLSGPTIITDGLVLHLDAGDSNSYPGSGSTWFDISGNNIDATLNGPTFSGNNGGMFLFDGSNDYVETIITSLLSFSGDYTIGFLVKVQSSNTTDDWSRNHAILWRGDNGNSDTYGIGHYQSSFTNQMERASDGDDFPVASTNNYPINNWNYVTMVRSGSNILFYVNGILDRTVSTFSGAPYTPNTRGLVLGTSLGHGPSFSDFIQMEFISLVMYERVLTQQEITQNFNAFKDRVGL